MAILFPFTKSLPLEDQSTELTPSTTNTPTRLQKQSEYKRKYWLTHKDQIMQHRRERREAIRLLASQDEVTPETQFLNMTPEEAREKIKHDREYWNEYNKKNKDKLASYKHGYYLKKKAEKAKSAETNSNES